MFTRCDRVDVVTFDDGRELVVDGVWPADFDEQLVMHNEQTIQGALWIGLVFFVVAWRRRGLG